MSRSEIRFDDSTWHCAGRGFVIDRDSRKLRRKYERNAASCWYWLGEKSEADGKRVGEVETRGTRVADGKKRDSDGASNDDESKEEIQEGKEREKGDALGGVAAESDCGTDCGYTGVSFQVHSPRARRPVILGIII